MNTLVNINLRVLFYNESFLKAAGLTNIKVDAENDLLTPSVGFLSASDNWLLYSRFSVDAAPAKSSQVIATFAVDLECFKAYESGNHKQYI